MQTAIVATLTAHAHGRVPLSHPHSCVVLLCDVRILRVCRLLPTRRAARSRRRRTGMGGQCTLLQLCMTLVSLPALCSISLGCCCLLSVVFVCAGHGRRRRGDPRRPARRSPHGRRLAGQPPQVKDDATTDARAAIQHPPCKQHICTLLSRSILLPRSTFCLGALFPLALLNLALLPLSHPFPLFPSAAVCIGFSWPRFHTACNSIIFLAISMSSHSISIPNKNRSSSVSSEMLRFVE